MGPGGTSDFKSSILNPFAYANGTDFADCAEGPAFQKLNRKPNCIFRIEPADVMTPKLADVEPAAGTEAPGCPRFT